MKTKGLFVLALAFFFVSLSAVFAKLAFNKSGSSVEFVFFQIVFATLTMAVYVLLVKRYDFKFERSDITDYLVLGLLASGVAQLLAMTGLSLSTVSNFSLLHALIPVMAIFFSILLLKEKFTAKYVAITLAMMAGAVIFITKLDPRSISYGGIGDLMILGKVVIVGFTNVYAKKAMSDKQPETVSLGRFLFALPVLFAAVVLFGNFDYSGSWELTILSGVAFGIGNMLFYRGIGLTDPSTASNFNLATPVFGMIFGALVFGEAYLPVQFAGVAMILAGGIAMAHYGFRGKK